MFLGFVLRFETRERQLGNEDRWVVGETERETRTLIGVGGWRGKENVAVNSGFDLLLRHYYFFILCARFQIRIDHMTVTVTVLFLVNTLSLALI